MILATSTATINSVEFLCTPPVACWMVAIRGGAVVALCQSTQDSETKVLADELYCYDLESEAKALIATNPSWDTSRITHLL